MTLAPTPSDLDQSEAATPVMPSKDSPNNYLIKRNLPKLTLKQKVLQDVG